MQYRFSVFRLFYCRLQEQIGSIGGLHYTKEIIIRAIYPPELY